MKRYKVEVWYELQRRSNFKKRIMKTFKIEGWYRYNDEKDFVLQTLQANKVEDAIESFKFVFMNLYFYKIDIKEIV
jgi:hypothetical protein